MARMLGPKCKQCRRENMKLFLKGERCLTEKCAIERRAYPPGEHGRGRIKQSEYLLQLREKQKMRRYYGVLESQFRSTTRRPAAAAASPARTSCACSSCGSTTSSTGSASRHRASQGRQLVRHNHFTVNGKKVNIPSYQVSTGDVISMREGSAAKAVVADATDLTASVSPWLQADHDNLTGTVLRLPDRVDIDTPVQEQLIVEFYSK